MSLVASKADISQTIHSFATAFQQLAARDGQLTPPLEAFLTSASNKLAGCAQPFKAPQASSRSKVESGSFTTEYGESVILGEREKDVIKQVSDRLQIDELDAAVLLRAYRSAKGEDISNDLDASVGRSDEFWEQITAFVLEEQLRVIQIVALLLRTADFEARIPAEVVQHFASDVTTPQFAQTLLDRVSHLATTSVPASAIPFSPIWAKFWVQQQKALLEVYFLLYYNRLFPNGKSLSSVLLFVQNTVWGSLQVNEGLFDTEAQALAQDVAALCHLILIENMNLERAASPEAEEFTLIPEHPVSEDELLHPNTLQSVHQRVLHLIGTHPRQSALLALAWAAVLFRITESISSVPLPETYYDVAQEILPIDLQPRKDKRSEQANTSPQALWQLLVTHALSPQVSGLAFMVDLLSLPLLSANHSISLPTITSTDPNVAGYLSVLRSVLASLARLVHPSYLPAEDFDSLVAVFEAMYSNPDAGLLRGNFWGLFADEDENPIRQEEWQIFDVAAKRFPVEVGHFTRMILAVSGGRSPRLLESPVRTETEDEVTILANGCAERTTNYLGQPQSITQALPPISPVMPLPYEPARFANAGPTDIVATRHIKISPSLTVQPGTPGRVVSPFDQRPLIVSWDLSRIKDSSMSIFRFFGDCLKAFTSSMPGKTSSISSAAVKPSGDVFEAGEDQSIPDNFHLIAQDHPALAHMVAILRNVTQNAPRKTAAVLKAAFGDAGSGIQTLFAVLEKSATLDSAQTLFVITTNVITVLLADYPDEIWLRLRSSDIIFPLDKSSAVPVWGSRSGPHNKNILLQDKTKGTYERTLACLELVQGLILQAQWTVESDPLKAAKLKDPVLRRAIHWTLASVWTNYTSWKYRDLRQKFELGSHLASILSDILHEAAFESRGDLSSVVELVVQFLLVRPGHPQLSALFNTIVTGNDTLANLQRLGKTVDCTSVENCLYQHLKLSNRLLQLSRQASPTGPTLVERVFFAHNNDALYSAIVPEASFDPIHVLSDYVVNSGHDRIAVEAAYILTKMCALGADWGSSTDRPSFLSHLGSIQETESLLRKLRQLAGDPFVDSELQLAVWRLLSAIAAHQAGFASLLITGRQAVAVFDEPSTASSPDVETITSLALDVIRGWEEAWEVQPSLLCAALNFLLSIWRNYLESSKTLQSMRKETCIWTSLLKLAERSLILQRSEEVDIGVLQMPEVQYAYRRLAQASAVALYALDLAFADQMPESDSASASSKKLFLDIVASPERLQRCCDNAVRQTFDVERIAQVKQQVSEAFPPLSLDKYVLAQGFGTATYGQDFYYDVDILSRRLAGFVDTLSSETSLIASNAASSVREANALWSLADSEAAALKATVSWLQTGLLGVGKNKQISSSVESTCTFLISRNTVSEDSSSTAEAHYAGSLQLLQALAQYLVRSASEIGPNLKSSLLSSIASYLTSQTFSIEEGLQKDDVEYPATIFHLTYDAFRLQSSGSALTKRTADLTRSESAEVCLQSCIKACNSILLSAREASTNQQSRQRWQWAVSALCEILASPLCPSTPSWLAYCSQIDFFRHMLDTISSFTIDESNGSSIKPVLELMLSMAQDPQAAEKLALDGAIFSLCNNALTSDLESGSITSPSSTEGGEAYSGKHDIWLLFLAIVTQLTCHLRSSIPFMDQEVSTFLHMYRAQIHRSLHWTTNSSLSIADLKEHRAVLTLVMACVKSTPGATHLQTLSQDLLRSSLGFLPQLVYLLQHPNLLVSLVEPSTNAESDWLASDSGKSETVDLSEFHGHPVVATLTQEVLSLCWMIISTVVTYSEAFVTLVRDRVDWPKDRVLIAANANVSLDEPASLGSLFDLARFCTDVLRHCVSNTTIASENCPLQAYDVSIMRQTAEQCFEGTLLLMSTQIALTVQQQDIAGTDDRSSQRARRDLKELASDLVEEFLDRKSGQQANEKKLLDVLKAFVLNL